MAALTIKQETFCQKLIETGNASEAYRQAYSAEGMKPEVVAVKACELQRNGKVAVRLNELRAEIGKRHAVTVDTLLTELEEARQVARGREQAAAMVQATMGKAKLAGLDGDGHGGGGDLADALHSLIAKLPG